MSNQLQTRDAVIDYQTVMADTQQYKTPIKFTEPISAIDVEVESTNGATSNLGNFIEDIVTSIQVVDGSTVLHNLDMAQEEALQFYKTNQSPQTYPSEIGGVNQRAHIQILFGRYLWDKLYNLNALAFNNPQLIINLNKAAIRAAGATGFATGNNIMITTIARLFENVPATPTFLMAKQIENFVSVSSGDHRSQMPMDYAYTMMMARYWLQGNDIDAIVNNIKLTANVDQFVPFNRKTKQLDAETLQRFGTCNIKHDLFQADTGVARLLCNKENFYDFSNAKTGTPLFVGNSVPVGSQTTMSMQVLAGTTDATASNIVGTERGHALHASIPMFFGEYNDPTDYFDPTPYSKFELVQTQAVAAAICEVCAEQVRPNHP